MTTTLLPTRNALGKAVRLKSVNVLNPLVADLTDLHHRIKQAHWNLRGEAFFPLHRLLDEYSASVRGHIDEVAERATALGGIIDGTLSDAAAKSDLGGKEEPASKKATQRDWLVELADSYGNCGKRVLAGIKTTDEQDDFVTADLLTGVLQNLDKQLWILESHLNR